VNLHQACLLLHPDDDVAVARTDLRRGVVLAADGEPVTVRDDVPTGHKCAVRSVETGRPVHKYGQVIGFATRRIEPGEHVHSHNLAFGDFDRDDQHVSVQREPVLVPEDDRATFQGYVRPDGRVGTRNFLGVVTSVNCSATAAKAIARQVEASGVLDDHPGVDGVVALTHDLGCGMAGAGNEGFEVLRRTLSGYAQHPNFAGVLMLGLGCEVNQIGGLIQEQRLADRIRNMDIQSMGGTRKTVEAGIEFAREVLAEANEVRRETVPASELKVALQCGGSDGYSGVSANPALGVASDLVVRNGGTVILSETTETYGAEHLFTRRAVSREVGEKLVELMHWWEEYTR
jgi:altronate hydrolase